MNLFTWIETNRIKSGLKIVSQRKKQQHQAKKSETTMNQNFCRRTRREFLWQAGGGFTGLALAGMLDSRFLAAQERKADGAAWSNPLAAKPSHFAPKAKSVIFLFMYGGPSHIDTFDYKPT